MSVTHFIFDILLLYKRSSMKNSIFWARFTKLTPNITFIIVLLSSLYCPLRDQKKTLNYCPSAVRWYPLGVLDHFLQGLEWYSQDPRVDRITGRREEVHIRKMYCGIRETFT